MITLLERTDEMSVAAPTVKKESEVNTMTTLATFQRQLDIGTTRRARPRGIDRIVMRLSLMTLLWARRRADRGMLSHEEHTRRIELERAREQRERAAALLLSRLS